MKLSTIYAIFAFFLCGSAVIASSSSSLSSSQSDEETQTFVYSVTMDGVGGGVLDGDDCTCLIQAFETAHNEIESAIDGITFDLGTGGQCIAEDTSGGGLRRKLLYNVIVIQITGECGSHCRRELDSASDSSSDESSGSSSLEDEAVWQLLEETFCNTLKDSCGESFENAQNCNISLVSVDP